MYRLRKVPRNELGNNNSRDIGRRKGRKMQRLANVASGLPAAILMFVDECAASREKEQSSARHERHRTPGSNLDENVLHETHVNFRLHSTVDP